MNALLLLASGGGGDMSTFDPASPPAESIYNLSMLVFGITGLIFVIVEGVLIYCVVRFRRRAPTGPEPPQFYGSRPIEIAWTAAPALIVFVLILVTIRTLWEVKIDPPRQKAGDQALYVTVVGRQWWWEYTYESYNGEKLGFVTANELHIPVSEKGIDRHVYLRLESADVCHSFWVPKLGGKTDLIPGHPNQTWFMTERPGLFLGQCAEYCGPQHANMLIRVYAEPAEEFEQWLKHEKQPATEKPEMQAGKAAFLALSCVNCHRVRGTSAQGTFGPDLTHLASRKTLASAMMPNTPENLRKWVADPQQSKRGCLMPAFGLSDQDRNEVVRYLSMLQ